MKNIFKKNNIKKIYNKGFTLVELMVVVGIIAVISALSLFNSSKLNSSVLLSNTAYEVGLIIRDAQVAGIGARVLAVEGNSAVATTSNQGVYFNFLKPEQVIFFADLNRSNSYSGLTEDSQVYNIENKRAGKVLKICKIETNNSCTEIPNINIIFKRPNPEAYFYQIINDVATEITNNIAINMGFVGGECKSIIIYKTGAIQIDKSFCQ